MSQPCLLDNQHLADALQSPHLVDENLHQHDRHDREQLLVVLDGVDLENDETFGEQVYLAGRVQQEVVAPAR